MPMVFAQHRVADFDAWKPAYEADQARREENGMKDIAVFRQDGDENMIMLVWETDDPAGLGRMMSDPGLADKMKEAGVISQPEAWIGQPAG